MFALAYILLFAAVAGGVRNSPELSEAPKLRWVLLEVTSEGVKVNRHRLVDDGVPCTKGHYEPKKKTMFSVYHNTLESFPRPVLGDIKESVHFDDPRKFHHEHLDPHSDDINGTVVNHDIGYVSFRIHADIDTIHIIEHNHKSWSVFGPRKSKVHTFSRGVQVLEDTTFTSKPELITIQKVAPVEDTYNIVFLSGAYSQSKRSVFMEDVAKSVRFLKGTVTAEGSVKASDQPLSAQPWNRYFSFMNIFAIWDYSPQDGAEHPEQNGYLAEPKPQRLRCSYGTTIKRMLSCDFAEVKSLASYAPAANLILVLVNDDEYGGAGGSGQAALYTGSGFEKVLIHEMGHAAAQLSDEYDYGFTEEEDLDLTNCDKSYSNPSWKDWKAKWDQMQPGTAHNPVQVCGYSNYYRPTGGDKGDATCLMKSSGRPRLCDVCREGMLNNGIFSGNFSLASPRCPVEWETLVVGEDDTGYLHINPTILDKYMYDTKQDLWGPKFRVQWWCQGAPGNTMAACSKITEGVTTLGVGKGGVWPGADTVTGNYEVEARITDTVTDAIPYGWTSKGKTTSVRFRFKVVADVASSGCKKWDCNTRYERGTQSCYSITDPDPTKFEEKCIEAKCYWVKSDSKCVPYFNADQATIDASQICTLCDNGDDDRCNITYTSVPQSAEKFIPEGEDGQKPPVNFNDVKEALGGGTYAIFFAAAGVGMGMLIALYKTCAQTFGDDKNAHRYTKCNQFVRQLLLLLFMVLVWASVAFVGFGVYMLIQLEMKILSSIVVIIMIVSGTLLFMLSFFAFSAAAKRGKCILAASGIVLLLCSVGMVILTIIVQQLATHANDTVTESSEEWEAIDFGSDIPNLNWMEALRDMWKDSTKDHPDIICQFQEEMRCSGFQKSCFNVQNSYCPANCTVGNRYVNPCMTALQKKLGDNFEIASLISVIVTSILCTGLILTWILFGSLFCCKHTRPDSYERHEEEMPSFSKPYRQPAYQHPHRPAVHQPARSSSAFGSGYTDVEYGGRSTGGVATGSI
eukprot:TRINITY_DN13051_c0_g1_i1.p1 TRINITY_DN13051_c0_g1~~TRINITY_DN13051_c0_g1_i1.p1  ORF type:complete len:1021 (+),score=191.80 TRINITY_DN13051_c0_g1_i1:110-3172(+)